MLEMITKDLEYDINVVDKAELEATPILERSSAVGEKEDKTALHTIERSIM